MVLRGNKTYTFRRSHLIAALGVAGAFVFWIVFFPRGESIVLFPELNCGILKSTEEVVGVAKKFVWQKDSSATQVRVESKEILQHDDISPARVFFDLLLLRSERLQSSAGVDSWGSQEKRVSVLVSYCGEILAYKEKSQWARNR